MNLQPLNQSTTNTDIWIGRHLQLNYSTMLANETNGHGYVDMTDDEDTIFFAQRNVRTLENVIGASYALNKSAGINLRMRHYWSGISNKAFFRLQEKETGSIISKRFAMSD